jgi:non-specific serine/threonine protein kinase
VGEKKPSADGVDALLDFSVAVALGDDRLTSAEVRQLLASSGELVRLRGQWVELDRERLREVLSHWERARREAERGGLSFLDGMRLLAGAARMQDDAAALAATEGWSRVEAGAWLARTLEGLRGPTGLAATDPGADLRGTLRPYQKVGVAWLTFASSLRLGVCLADDMGLGKTIQVLGLLLLHKRRERAGGPPHLLVAPASLLANWQAEIDRFAPSLTTSIAHPSAMAARELAKLASADLGSTDLVITTYGTLARPRRCGRVSGRW